MKIDELKIKIFICRLFILPSASALNQTGTDYGEGEVNPMNVELTIQKDEGTMYFLGQLIHTFISSIFDNLK